MRKFALLIAGALTLLCLVATGASALFQAGPHSVDVDAEKLGKPLIFVGKKALERSELPQLLIDAVKKEGAKGPVLLVGSTDAIGPKVLNASLGMQYAVDTAHRVAGEAGLGLWNIYCATLGELDEGREAGVAVYGWTATDDAKPKPSTPVQILTPADDAIVSPELWMAWDNDATSVVWSREEAGKVRTWNIESSALNLELPFPAMSRRSGLGANFGGGQGASLGSWQEVEVDPALVLSVESLETGYAKVMGKVAVDSRDVVVWAGGIPYPVTPNSEGVFEASIARYMAHMETYTQVADAKGRVRVGPVVYLPPSVQGSPKALVVLTWVGVDVDLDLHAWLGDGHTQPMDPDPGMSATAAKGATLLFDGDRKSQVSALWVDELEGLEVEVNCFSDLGKGAQAMMYVVYYPDDPVMSRGSIMGPRYLSGKPEFSRWPALNLRGQ